MSTTELARPRVVELAFWLLIAAAVVGIVAAVIEFLAIEGGMAAEMKRQAEASNVPIDPAALAATARAAIIVGLVVAGVFAVVWLLFAVWMRGGRNWARIVLTVLGAADIVLVVASLRSVGLDTVFSVVEGVLIVVGIVLMFRPAANAYFRPVTNAS